MRPFRIAVIVVLALTLSAQAFFSVTNVPIGSGDLMMGASGAIVPLSSTSLLVPAEGNDETRGTDDDVVLFVRGIGGSPVVAALPAPYQTKQSGGASEPSGSRLVRLSATRAVMATAGPDRAWNTSDDNNWFLTDLGGANDCYPVGVAHMLPGACSPVPLTDRFFVQVTTGPDGTVTTADDRLYRTYFGDGFVSGFDYVAPYLTAAGANRPVALTPDSCLVLSAGPDRETETADDLLYLFRGLLDSPVRTDIPTPYLRYGSSSQPVRIDDDRALVTHSGEDGAPSTADDGVYYLTGLATGGTPSVTDVPVACIFEYAAGRPVVVGPERAVVATAGPDGDMKTLDDAIAVLEGFTAVSYITVAPIDEDGQCRPTLLTENRIVFPTYAHPPQYTTSGLVTIFDLGGSNTAWYFSLPGLFGGISSLPLRVSSNAIAVANGGPGGAIGGGDDRVTLVTDLDSAATTQFVMSGGDFDDEYYLGFSPVALGSQRAAFLNGGPDGVSYDGDDALIRPLGEVPFQSTLDVAKMKTSFSAEKPEKGEKFSLSGTLVLDTAEPFGSDTLRVSLGRISDTIPASLLVGKSGKWSYKRPKDGTGFIAKLQWDSVKGKLKISGAGVGSGIETTNPGYFPVAFEFGDNYFGTVLMVVAGDKGLTYSAPK